MFINSIDTIEQADKFFEVALYSIGSDYNDGFLLEKRLQIMN